MVRPHARVDSSPDTRSEGELSSTSNSAGSPTYL